MSVAFKDNLLTIRFSAVGAFGQFTLIPPKSHCTAFLRNFFLIGHEVDDSVGCFFVKLCAIGILQARTVSCKFNDCTLHAQTDTKKWYLILSGIFYGD